MLVNGFELMREANIDELKTQAKLYRHARTGAELLSLSNDDENKVFGIVFRTPQSDSTGVAHILEHAVLCGSRKYPVKEPFVELLKGSLKTFLNAFTYPDKTCYPVASQNLQDFYNLVDVYLDAVFYPRITPFIFQQEGWHLEMEDPEGPISYKGVVFNEMKGAYSSPESLLSEAVQQSLFPETTYGFDSGGDPKRIPDLTYERFRAFHRELYHPSNARIYFYGDDDPQRRLSLLDEYLEDFDPITPNSTIRLQPELAAPKRVVRLFASSGNGDVEEKGSGKEKAADTPDAAGPSDNGMMTVNWLLPETLDTRLNLSLNILHFILLGMPGSPLRKALIDSGLGEGLAGVGLENDLRQMYFSTGLKGIDIGNVDRIEALILDTLATLARDGIDPHTIEAAMNTIEFRLRENNSGHYPRGLVLMLRALTTWLHAGDPLALLAFEEPLAAIKSCVAAEKYTFENMIRTLFLDNPHRTTVVLEPDPHLAEREENAEREGLEALRQSMSRDQVTTVIENARELRRLQEAPDSAEALATIPTLKISDLDGQNKIIPLTVLERDGATILHHDISTNRVAYLDVGFNLHCLPQQYLPYVPLFGRALLEMGTEGEDFVTLSQRISRKTGGIRPDLYTSTIRGKGQTAGWLYLRGKSMLGQADDLLAILRDVLLTVRLDNRERFRQMALEEKARQEEKLIPNGHQMVNLRLRSHFSEADWAMEQMHGVSYLLFVRKLARDVDEDWPAVLAALEAMRHLLVNRDAMLLNITLDGASFAQIEPPLAGFLASLPAAPVLPVEWIPDRNAEFEGLIVPAQINYVGKGANLYDLGYQFNGSILVISGYLRTSWLWERVRVQGGAYGAFCNFDRHSGVFSFVSYRDPNVMKTIENFDGTADFLRHATLTGGELTKGIIGTIGQLDTYLLPDAKGYTSMMRYLSGDTDEARQSMREEVLATTAADFRNFADVLDKVGREGIVKVLGSQNALEESGAGLRPGWLQLLKVR